MTGRIVKATGGFYYVDIPNPSDPAAMRRIECRGRGVFRNRGITPLVGDMAVVELSSGEGTGSVVEILPRKNSLVRPPLSNLDRMVLVLSVTDPEPNILVADTYLAILAHRGIGATIAITKADLAPAQELAGAYKKAGFPVYLTSGDNGVGELMIALSDGISAFCGNSGVGKSTLLNRLHPQLGLATGETSKKLGRGRHTTRHVELLYLPGGGLVADTPGFSSLEMLRMGHIPKEELAGCFVEFTPFLGGCRFNDCSHTVETGCAVLDAVADGDVGKSRHESYRALYAQAKEVREWEHR
ncbi:MAG: ribosome small subunit-dependent GTPase A [Oscillospiraceae bacterium]|nr:ribosome small subunit-dependent GTPase A [Oscillospiraceae bacterium]